MLARCLDAAPRRYTFLSALRFHAIIYAERERHIQAGIILRHCCHTGC